MPGERQPQHRGGREQRDGQQRDRGDKRHDMRIEVEAGPGTACAPACLRESAPTRSRMAQCATARPSTLPMRDQHDRLGHELANQPGARRPERTAHGQLAPAAFRAHQQQARRRSRRRSQQQPGAAEQHQQQRPDVADDHVETAAATVRALVPIRVRILLLEAVARSLASRPSPSRRSRRPSGGRLRQGVAAAAEVARPGRLQRRPDLGGAARRELKRPAAGRR